MMTARSSQMDASDPAPKRKEGEWEMGRELRALRDIAARSRAEEASAFRRGAEEIERCILRRQTDETLGLQNFFTGFHDELDRRFELQSAQYLSRLVAVERRLDHEVQDVQCLKATLLKEVTEALSHALQGSSEACDGMADKDDFALAQRLDASTSCALRDLLHARLQRMSVDVASTVVANTRAMVLQEARRTTEETISSLVADAVAQRRAEMETLRVELERRLDDCKIALQTSCEDSQNAVKLEVHEARKTWEAKAGDRLVETLEELKAMQSSSGENAEERISALQAAFLASQEMATKLVQDVEATKEAQEQQFGSLQRRLVIQETAAGEASEEARQVGHVIRNLSSGFRENVTEAAEIAVEALRKQLEESIGSVDADLRREVSSLRQHTSEESTMQSAKLSNITSRFQSDVEQWVNKCLSTTERRLMESSRHALQHAEVQSSQQLQRLSESQSAQHSRLEAHLEEEASRLDAELWEVRQEANSLQVKQKMSNKEAAEALSAVQRSRLDESRASAAQAGPQQDVLSHEWLVPKCMQRLDFLGIAADVGAWLESPPFFRLGQLQGRFMLRLYPRGLRGAEGRQCALGLLSAGMDRSGHTEGQPHHMSIPLRVNLSIGGLSRQAVACCQDDGSVLWISSGFGSLEEHVDESGDVLIYVEVPPRPWTTLHSAPSGIGGHNPFGKEDMPAGPALAPTNRKLSLDGGGQPLRASLDVGSPAPLPETSNATVGIPRRPEEPSLRMSLEGVKTVKPMANFRARDETAGIPQRLDMPSRPASAGCPGRPQDPRLLAAQARFRDSQLST